MMIIKLLLFLLSLLLFANKKRYLFRRSYLILGREKDDSPAGMVITGSIGVTQRSIVIEWRNEWDQRMRRFRRRARKCNK